MSTLSYSLRIFLLSLAALMFISASEGLPFVRLPCWKSCNSSAIQNIKSCYEQRPRKNCETHGFVVTNKDDKVYCIKGTSQWINGKISQGKIKCPPDISPPH
ncbi:hypothetical protein AMECASPLE_017135 [Ameca splendens]|uniref:Uncharacterized protein n=1 Tax=Ameca splendens TaxID=208324 RepID=A0ABV0ZMW2_9TELE